MEHFESGDDNEISESIERKNLHELGLMDDALEPYYAGLVASDGHIEPDTNRSVVASGNPEFVNNIIEPVVEEQELRHSTFWDDGAGVYKISINNEELGFRYPEQDRRLKELLADREQRSEAGGTG